MLKFHPLRIAERTVIADDAVALGFTVPDTLRAEYGFMAGQHVAVRAILDGQEERRTYSIANPEGSDQLRIGVRVQSGGRMAQYLADGLHVGDTLDVLTPNGSFHTQIEPAHAKRYVAFAAGSGITPVVSIAATVLQKEPASQFQLYYGNTSTARTMFLDEVLALKDLFLPRFSVCFVMSREPQEFELFNGRIDSAKVLELARHEFDAAAVDEFFICGPGSMAEDVQAALTGLGARGRVHVEHFVATASAAAPAAVKPAVVAAGAAMTAADGATITVVMDGRRRAFKMPMHGEVILDAAGRAGLDLPFSCRAGVCSTCRARLLSGTAEMEHNVALEDWEVEAGYILCCQARPTSPALEISYDE
ncbi:MAG: 2Fe-2S iron-sulfur cluster binding protein [Steroidobacteraceae bacterium]|nr:2Fe-2S iron-sulfur cluster binding protein [Steroidobacteraceae bacterium]MBM2854557.1 2Fe-2S iron-sulfur cluster binding protein [Steroidobacteraceae bacterium]